MAQTINPGEAPAEFVRFDLLTRRGEYVTRCAITFMNPLPEAIGYGSRVFFKTKRKGTPGDPVAQENPDYYDYVEGIVFWPIYFNQAGSSRDKPLAFSHREDELSALDADSEAAADAITDTTLGRKVE